MVGEATPLHVPLIFVEFGEPHSLGPDVSVSTMETVDRNHVARLERVLRIGLRD
jgi:hypothetical protein